MRQVLFNLLAITGFVGAVALWVPEIITLGLFAGILPGIALLASPTAFMYLIAFSIGWYGGRRFGVGTATATALACVATCAFVFPGILNGASRARIERESKREIEPARPIARPSSLAILQPPYDRYDKGEVRENESSCDDLCLTVLYSGLADRVTMGASQVTDPNGYRAKARPHIEYRLKRMLKCPVVMLPTSAKWADEWEQRKAFRTLINTVRVEIDRGNCLLTGPGRAANADLMIVILQNNILRGKEKYFARPFFRLQTMELMRQGESVARDVQVRTPLVASPLLIAPNGWGIAPDRWDWYRGGNADRKIDTMTHLRELTGWQFEVPAARLGPESHHPTKSPPP